LLILGGDIPGLVAVTPASAAAAKSAHAMTDLGTLGGTQSAAYAINDNGQSVASGQIVASGSNTQGQERVPAHIQLVTASRTYHPLA
jgi:uncharacterized membrane protein